MKKSETDAKDVLNQLGDFSSFLTEANACTNISDCFNHPLDIMQKTMSFDVSVLYKITNVVENNLLLKIIKVFDPKEYRSDFFTGKRLLLNMDRPNPIYMNEVTAFKTRKLSCINIPDIGCDIMGYIYLPKSLGGGYLFGGDFCGKEADVRDYEASVCEIMCNFLSVILIKSQFEQLAVYDNLTGLYNARKIKEEVQGVCARFKRKPGGSVSLVMGDIDYFKKINDTWGHIQGDVILKEVGNLLAASMREYFDVAGRYGGEEFLLIVQETDQEASFIIVERLRSAIETHQFTRVDKSGKPVKGDSISITMSFGIAVQTPDTTNCDAMEWIGRADIALYKSKETGRNRTTVWEGE